ncbi:MAG TPA: hypothetical protein VJ765_05775 [Chitinophagaceae bacterium]|nr:hypothetical protein [Chitinophagaceae bacterium]
MKLSAAIIDTTRVFIMMVIFSVIVFMAYSAEKKFLENYKKEKEVPGKTCPAKGS